MSPPSSASRPWLLLFVGLWIALGRPPARAGEDLLIRDVRLFTGTTVVQKADVLVRDGQIAAIRPFDAAASLPTAGDGQLSLGVTVVDGAGRTLLPGLIDTHVHLVTGSTTPTEAAHLAFVADALPGRLQRYLDRGVTTVRSLGDALSVILDVRAALLQGQLVGPELLVAGPVITAPGGLPIDLVCAGQAWCEQQMIRSVASAADAQAAVDELALAGVDAIKVVYDDLGGVPKLTPDLVTALALAAHGHGLPVAAHAGPFVSDSLDLLGTGVASLEHTPFQPVDGTGLGTDLALAGVAVVPTLAKVEATQPGVLALALQNAARLRADGATVVLGSDASGSMPPGDSSVREVQLLVQSGWTPVEALEAATALAADLLGLPDRGRLAVGLRADLLLVDGDPTQDVEALDDVVLVLQAGRPVAGRVPGTQAVSEPVGIHP